ncbi:MAG TPA: hypothetical protein VFT18_06755 [Gaiellaceae bacterium]|nr:hypothetical protein [Gaiellaceae bacterium]
MAKSLAGGWESSGIVDASKFFGKGAFLVDVQAHTLAVQEEVHGPLTFVREGGQLLLFRLPNTGDQGYHHGDHKGKKKGHGKKGRG